MSEKYEKIYAEARHALGDPFDEVVKYFNSLEGKRRVLDLGAGQGRDSLMIAKLGHAVHAVDLSPTGLQQLEEDAEGLEVATEVADLTDYTPSEKYDIILIDRTLHMLGVKAGIALLERILPALEQGGEIYIIDEKSNIPSFQNGLENYGLRIILQSKTSIIAKHSNKKASY